MCANSSRAKIPADRRITVAEFVRTDWYVWLAEQVPFGNLRPGTVSWYKSGARRLVDGLIERNDDKEGIRSRLERLITTTMMTQPSEGEKALRSAADGFGRDRNVLTHLNPVDAWSFSDVVVDHRSVTALWKRIGLITAAIFAQTSDEQFQAGPPYGSFSRAEADLRSTSWMT